MRQEGGAKKIRVSLNKNKKKQNLTRKQKALKTNGFQRFTILISDHDRILTYNLLIRSQMLYTVELRSRFCFASANVMHFFDSAK